MKKIVIVEDDRFMREELEDILRKEGYETKQIVSFEHPAADIRAAKPDLVLLDVNLPKNSGFEICRELKKDASVPVLILTSRDQLSDELHALELGADEYLTKPCHSRRLAARIRNLLRRYEGRRHLLEGEGFLLDTRTYTLHVGEDSRVLTEKEGKILELLLRRRGELVTKEELFTALWGTLEYIDENALQVNMTRLRRTLKEQGLENRVETIRGKGYRLRQAASLEPGDEE